MSNPERRHQAVTALMRHLFREDLTGVSVDGFASLFLEQLTGLLALDSAALILDGRIRAVGLAPDRAALADDITLAWARDAGAGVELALGNVGPDIVESALGIFVCLAERRRAEQRLLHDAFHDALTGLPNRTLFVEHLDHAVERARRSSGYMFSVLFVDVDRFKLVNDGLGHEAGDRLLVGFAQRLRRLVRGGDVVARLGGDEFAILADELAEVNDAIQMASRIKNGLRAPFDFDGRNLNVSASVGIARSAPKYRYGCELLRDADIAMCRAKAQGGGRHRMFDAEMHTSSVARLQLETDLRAAVGGNQLRLVYQPIIRVAGGHLAGFEALLRWRHPTRGNIPPADFIGVAEETGMIVRIGQWTLREVCRRLAALNCNRSTPVSISVNLSDSEFLQPRLVEEIELALREHGVPSGSLHIELTERMLMVHASTAAEVLPRLRAAGVKLMLDDFGTGQSSLSRLERLPVDGLKLDYSFIRGMETSRARGGIVRAVVGLAHDLGIKVVAEGVERAEQLALLSAAGCDYAQGYLFSEALEERNVSPMLAREAWLPA
ncbi:MAG: EAL domain-containing protein [Gammaproteobacteria bacterium]